MNMKEENEEGQLENDDKEDSVLHETGEQLLGIFQKAVATHASSTYREQMKKVRSAMVEFIKGGMFNNEDSGSESSEKADVNEFRMTNKPKQVEEEVESKNNEKPDLETVV